MLKLISKLVGSKSDRDLKKLQPHVESVNAFDAALKTMSNAVSYTHLTLPTIYSV